MNVERLHLILHELSKDFNETKLQESLNDVKTNLQNQVNQPAQPVHQTNLVEALNVLNMNLLKSKYNDFNPGWKEIVDEIKGENLLGKELLNRIEIIFNTNTITPAKALEDINLIHQNIHIFNDSINLVLNGFKTLKIGKEELNPGECELGYMIPREYVENKLNGLNEEITDLKFILDNISEIITGQKIDFEVKTISSSDFLLYIILGIEIANFISKVIDNILEKYKKILEIKKLRNELKKEGIPDKETIGIDKYVNGMMKEEIDRVVNDAIKNYTGENGRKNELKNGLTISLNKIANRLDKGFKIEIRVEPLPVPKEDEEISEEEKIKINLTNETIENASKIEFLQTHGESILKLTEKMEK